MGTQKGFIFTLDAVFSLIVASAAMSILLYMNFSTPAYQAQQNQAASLLQNMLRTSVGQIAQGQSLQMAESGYRPVVPSGYADFLQNPAGYIRAVAPPQYVNSITVSFWIDPMNNSLWGNPGNYWENAVSGSKGCWDSYYFYIEASGSPPGVSWSVTNTGGAQERDGASGIKLVPNQWQQLIGVYNGSDLAIYWDGNQIGTPVAATGTVVYNGTTISGTNPTSSGGCNPISGGIANVQIYANAISPAAARTIYAEGIGGAPVNGYSLLGWWPLDGNANDYAGITNGGTTYTSFVGSSTVPLWGYNATSDESVLHAIAELYLNGQSAVAGMLLKDLYNISDTAVLINNRYAPAMNISYFDGTNSYVQVNSTPSLAPGAKATFSAWIYPESLAGCGVQNCIILNKENSYELAISSNGQLCWALNNTAPAWNWECPPLYVSAGKWNYVAVAYNGSAVVAYLNGVNASPFSASGVIKGTGLAFRIGARGAPGAPGSPFFGDIADVQLYNTSLSKSQIDSLYYEGLGGLPVNGANLLGWWPLDGNANDYSGNGNSGTSVAVQYNQVGIIPIGLENAYSVSKASAPMSLNAGGINSEYNVSLVVWK